MRILPTFKGYTIDYRLQEFRRAELGEELEFIRFETEEGRRLLQGVRQDPTLVIHEGVGDDDAWVCVCGNRPSAQGFHPCDRSGEWLEPMAEAWPEPLYVCERCNRIIDADTLAVVSLPVEIEEPAAA